MVDLLFLKEDLVTKSQRYLRAESRPFSWSALTRPERFAFERVAASIAEAVEGLAEPKAYKSKREQAIHLDPGRASRLIFLTGKRGTGKTSVLLSLIRACVAIEEWDAEVSGNSDGALLYNTASQLIGILRKRVVWLEPLDMEPLPRPTNLLAAILARIETAVEHFNLSEGHNSEVAARGMLVPSHGELDALTDLQRLQTNAAVAWDGNLPERASALDPDAFAVELMRVERARLSINSELSRTLNGLAGLYKRDPWLSDPLFLLPVDDFDLNPTRCLDLLRLLRAISVPRLFSVILGDEDVAESLFRVKVSGDVAEIARRSASEGLLGMPVGEISALGGEVAANAMRKLVPPSQRVALTPLDAYEATLYRPEEGDPTLGELLDKVTAYVYSGVRPEGKEKGLGIDSLLKLLIPGLARSHRHRRPNFFPGQYTGSQFLAAPIRHVADLWLAFQNADKESIESFNIVVNETKRAISEDADLTPAERRWMLDAIVPAPHDSWLLDTSRLDSKAVRSGEYIISRSKAHDHVAQGIRGWSIAPRRQLLAAEGAAESGVTLMFSRCSGCIALLHDLTVFRYVRGRIVGPSLVPSGDELDIVRTRWHLGLAEPILVPWPMPPVASIWECDMLGSEYERHDWHSESPFTSWIASCAEILTGLEVPEEAWFREKGAIVLAKWLRAHIPSDRDGHERDPREGRLMTWLMELGALLSPECGASPEIAAPFVRELGEFWRSGKGVQVIRERRAMALTRLVKAGRPDVAVCLSGRGRVVGRSPQRLAETYGAPLLASAAAHPINRYLRGALCPTFALMELQPTRAYIERGKSLGRANAPVETRGTSPESSPKKRRS